MVRKNLRYEKTETLSEPQASLALFSHAFSRFFVAKNILVSETAHETNYFSARPLIKKTEPASWQALQKDSISRRNSIFYFTIKDFLLLTTSKITAARSTSPLTTF